jgi:hypothetical protein
MTDLVRTTRFVFLLFAAVAAFTAPVLAGARATLILTSGARVSGILSGLSGADFKMDGGSAGETRIPIGTVAVIDFVGDGEGIPAAEISKMQAGRMLAVERGGATFYGRLIDMRGDNPPRLVFTTQEGELEVNASEVARVYLRRWDGMPLVR